MEQVVVASGAWQRVERQVRTRLRGQVPSPLLQALHGPLMQSLVLVLTALHLP